MNPINPINLTSGLGALTSPLRALGPSGEQDTTEGTFADVLSGLIKDVNGLQATAGELRNQLLAGEAGDLHQYMIASEKAGIAMELLVEVRNKIVEAYQQLMRMPV